jgi:DNA topoisomerase-1
MTGTAIEMYLKTFLQKGSPIPCISIESTVVVRNKHQHYTEASLINKLEELGIGRPSTFATLVETIIDRGYVKKTDIEGSPLKCTEYKLVGKVLEESIRDRIFGAEKNKLVIQPTGILTIEFLLKTFEQLFSYEYTKNMEEYLDKVSLGNEKNWAKICSECLNEIKVLSKNIKNIGKQVYPIDEEHELVFSFNGPVLRKKASQETVCENKTEDIDVGEGEGEEEKEKDKKEYEYIQVKKDFIIDLEKLKRGEYKYDDLVEIKNPLLGTYEGHQLYLKNGRYGAYVEWGDKKESIKSLKMPFSKITLQDITTLLSEKVEKNENNVLKVLNDSMAIRKGKYGFYVFYKREDMPKPQFLNIKAYKGEIFGEDTESLVNWLNEKYKL